MAASTSARPPLPRRLACIGVAAVVLAAGCAAWLEVVAPAAAQQQLAFPKQPARAKRLPSRAGGQEQMLVQAAEIQYDYTNERVSAVGNVQIYYAGSTLEADRVIYDQKSKRLHAEGNVRLTEADGKITHGTIMDLSDDYRDGFVDSLRLETPDQTRFAATRADRSSGRFTVFQNGVYTACKPCKDDPRKPPLWQVKGARIIHDQGEKMIYFENARIEFFGVPVAYLPYFSAPDPTVKRKTGFLLPTAQSSAKFGVGVQIPYFWALAPDYDLTFSPLITSRQGPLLQAEWRQRLMSGSYMIRGAGIRQLDKDYFLRSDGTATPGYRDWRGSIESTGQFNITNRWVWGWEAMLFSDKTFQQDYGISRFQRSLDPTHAEVTEGVSRLYLSGRGDRSYFDIRGIHYYGFSELDDQNRLPVIHPVLDYDYTLMNPVLGGELSFKFNITSLSRSSASFDAISPAAMTGGLCGPFSADPAVKIPTNCLLRGVPGTYSRFSGESVWRRSYTDSYGQVFTPFVSLRADAAVLAIKSEIGVSNYITTGEDALIRGMPAVGVEYRYPFVSVHSWGTQTIEPIAQLIVRPDEPSIGKFPNEDAQSLVFDDTNLFRISKFSGWDRVEGGGRLNTGVQYTAQFNRAGFVNVLVGQSYHLFGGNSFAAGDTTNTGLDSGLETWRSDYVARIAYQPNSIYTFTTRFRFDEQELTTRRFELEGRANFDRWTVTMLYGNYDAQPTLGFLTRRQGLLGTGSVKLTQNWVALGGARYNIEAGKVDQTRIGVGYVDDCLILALNYITDYAYSGNPTADHRVTLQMSLRTLGGTTGKPSVGQQ